MGKAYGYVRVSTKEQNEARQILAMKAYGISRECLIVEKQSGKDFERPKYKKLMRKIKAGDTLIIKSIDRRKALRRPEREAFGSAGREKLYRMSFTI